MTSLERAEGYIREALKMKVNEAFEYLIQEEEQRLIDMIPGGEFARTDGPRHARNQQPLGAFALDPVAPSRTLPTLR